MRLRRVLGTTSLPLRRGTARAPNGRQPPAASGQQPAPETKRPPEEVHPSTVWRTGLGLFKYTTGLLQSAHRDHRAYSLKVYSDRPIQRSTWQRLASEAARRRIKTKTVSAASLLTQLSAWAAEPYAELNHVGDVHCQIFGSSRALKTSRTRRDRLQQPGGDWDVSLLLHRSADRSGTAIPAVKFQTARFELTQCTIRSIQGRRTPHVRLAIVGHLRPDFIAGRANAVPPRDEATLAKSIGGAFEELELHTTTSIQGTTFDDLNGLLLSLRNAIVQWLPSSAIGTLVKLSELEITLGEDPYLSRRHVSNTVIDGTAKKPFVDSRSHIPSTNPPDKQTQTLSVTHSEPWMCDRSPIAGPQNAMLVAKIRYTDGDANLPSPTPEDLAKQFQTDRLDEDVAASARIAQMYPHVSGSVKKTVALDHALQANGYEGDLTAAVQLAINDQYEDSDFRLELPALHIEKSCGVLAPPSIIVGIHASCRSPSRSDDSSSVEVGTTLSDELPRVAKMSAIVLQTIWAELGFGSYHEAAQLAAEALARTIGFKSANVVVDRVEIALTNPDADSSTKEWSVVKATGHVDEQCRSAALATSNLSRTRRSTAHGQDKKSSGEEASPRQSSGEILARNPEVLARPGDHYLLKGEARRSELVERALGMKSFRFSIDWLGCIPRHVQPVRSHLGLQAVEHAVSQGSAPGLRRMLLAWQRLVEHYTGAKDVQLVFFDDPISPADAGTEAQNGSHFRVTLQGSPANSAPDVLLRLKAAGLTTSALDGVDEAPFQFHAKVQAADSDCPASAAYFRDLVTGTIKSLPEERQYRDPVELTRAFAEAFRAHEQTLAGNLAFTDVGLKFYLPSGGESYWESSLRDKSHETSPEIRVSRDGVAHLNTPHHTLSLPLSQVLGFKQMYLNVHWRSDAVATAAVQEILRDLEHGMPDAPDAVVATAVQKILRDMEQKVLDAPTTGLRCIQTLWKGLASHLPTASNLQIGLFSAADDRSDFSVLAEGSPRAEPKLKFRARGLFKDASPGIYPFGVQLYGRLVDGDRTSSASHLHTKLAEAARSVSQECGPPDEPSLTQAFAGLFRQQEDELEGLLAIERVDPIKPDFGNHNGKSKMLRVSNPETRGKSEVSEPLDLQAQSDLSRAELVELEPAPPAGTEVLHDTDDGQTTVQSITGETTPPHPPSDTPATPSEEHLPRTFIALGSNVGDRLACIEEACRALDAESDIRVVRTSRLYETKPMYVEDQAPFLNGVCEIETSLAPMDLLDRTQAIERNLGRVKTIDKGPRNIDLDILLHGETVMKTERLTIPHSLMLERHFVLRPLVDLLWLESQQHPTTRTSFRSHLRSLGTAKPPMYSSTFVGEGCPSLRPLDPQQATAVMAILNVTPDSFSDGGDNPTTDENALKDLVRRHIADGATIIDIGGQSSRPNAPDVTADEEIRRILPAIAAIKSLPESAGIAISVDTYRARVAEAAIDAGAHIINDISAGLLDEDMLPTVARLGCTYIMMHMRGTPSTMQSPENCSYPDGLFYTIRRELHSRVDAAERAGIRRWRLILDPGVGFSKTAEQNAEILGRMNHRAMNGLMASMPWLVGPSRKGFIGKFTGVDEAKERTWGTAATITAAVAGGADIVRVHDVREMGQVVRMADAMYRVTGAASSKAPKHLLQ